MSAQPAVSLADRLKAGVIALLPAHLVSRLVYRLSRCRLPWVKNALIGLYIRLFDIDMSEARESSPFAYANWNAFFTRALREDARPVDPAPEAIVSPVDGRISELGALSGERILQAKGRDYSLAALVGKESDSRPYENGHFITLYLSPRDYHRIHMPCRGRLRSMRYIPGRLFSVAPHTVRSIDSIFARNERVVCHFETDSGPMAVVLVGAINVGSMETCWHGPVTPPYGREVREWHYDDREIVLEKGQELGRFNLGSTVIVLFGPDQARWRNDLHAGSRVLMGQRIGICQTVDSTQ
ncbi:MAG: phosphatidylserine decarboxylase [Gammaproteobacteria bacterium]|nr:MAG: phosphatidylserine decarboxylase [Gammaproteobacteria bacterium]